MANWRELGEVPDSEDDDFDSQNTDQPALPIHLQGSISSKSPNEVKDIWDIPSSQDDNDDGLAQLPTSTHRSPRKPTPPTLQPTEGLRVDSSLSTLSSRLSETPSLELDQYDLNQRDNLQQSTPSPRNSGQLSPIRSQILGHDSEELLAAQRLAVSYERSLRTRKPEQLRPYHTERARFNSEWRQHGLRPVRIINDEDRRRQDDEELLEEEEFQPETQESASQHILDEWPMNPNGNTVSSSQKSLNPPNDGNQSSQPSIHDDTDNTTVDGEDLPSLEDLISRKHKSSTKKNTRHAAFRSSKNHKGNNEPNHVTDSDSGRPRFIMPPGSPNLKDSSGGDSWEQVDLEVDTNTSFPISNPSPRKATTSYNRPSSLSQDLVMADDDSTEVIDPFESSEQSQLEDGDSAPSGSSESESEIVNQNSRKIKGVLPASWLRLDQKSSRSKLQKRINRRPLDPLHPVDNRRGVARRKEVSSFSRSNNILLEQSEEDVPNVPGDQQPDEVIRIQTFLDVGNMTRFTTHEISSDDESIMEYDYIEPLLASRKRQLKLPDAFQSQSKRQKGPKTAGSLPFKPGARPKRGSSLHSRSLGELRRKPKNPSAMRYSKLAQKQRPAPRLSILDVIEPDAPRFIRIAARTAKGRRDRGRDSPNRKTIQLANRRDHIDAIGSLQDWTSGSIRQRPSVSAMPQKKRAVPKNHAPFKRAAFKVSAQLGGYESVTKQTTSELTRIKRTTTLLFNKLQKNRTIKASREAMKTPSSPKNHSSHTRVAQLEAEPRPNTARFAFHSGKKTLDRLYQGDASLSSETNPGLSKGMQDTRQLSSFPPTLGPTLDLQQGPISKSCQRRKKTKPQRIDIEAPQYSHANDPLPPVLDLTLEAPAAHQTGRGAKLFGLGPYGTQYTHHFEVFPLHADVFFHGTTLIGTGAIETATRTDYCQSLRERKQKISFMLDGETFQWGEWTSQVSSELGLLLDHILDQLEPQNNLPNTSSNGEAIAGVTFLLSYVNTAMSFAVESDLRSFLSRILEAMQNFNTRITSIIEGHAHQGISLLQPIIQVLDCVLIIIYLCMRISRTNPCLVREQFSIENLLKLSANIAIQILLKIGPRRVRQRYSEIDHPSRRGRGLGVHDSILHSWVVTMKVLEAAQIPQASFWALFQRAVLSPTLLSSVDVREHEQIWDNLFILLPLTEFSNVGRLVPGQRHRNSSDGWGLPQQLLKRIFHLYQENKHQSPGFNDYCRALIGRCHYLVEQWGWHKCASVVGVIFDFFGSQNLAHLRNEEAYSSPRFLEELGYRPSLCIEREDRCFHIFLKLIALGLQKLRAAGSLKDIRNLVARVVPNHNRQYLKEQNIHESDLSALRNHHDLLCTLYWASPADLRPSVSLIQGLIVPANSHKAACLINLRAWSQLARFIVVSGEATTSLKPFNTWRSSFFQEIVDQYESIAPDIEQQLSNLSKDVTKSISSEMVSAMISLNKTAVTDILYTCVAVSREVIQHAPDLEAALFCLSTGQLQQVFVRFCLTSPGLDWPILRASLATLETFISRVDEFKANEQSQDSESQILNSAQADDALQVLSRDIAKHFFYMTHCVLSADNETRSFDQTQCIELAVALAARLGMRLSEAGFMHLFDIFKPGDYGLFRALPHHLSLNQRKYLPIFVTTLLRHGFFNWDGERLTLIEFWLISVVKPREAFGYEKEFAKQLIRHEEAFVPNMARGLINDIDYEVNRQFLEHAVSSMRKSIRDAEPTRKKNMQLKHGRVLKHIMFLMRNDLKILLRNTREHHMYMSFVREAIALIKTHASDFCSVDDFFYQVNQEYSPPQQDPQLQVATLVSYGIRLVDGDTKVEHPLFFFLLNQLKLAVMDDRMHEEAILLYKGMQAQGILRFILGKMLPAIVQVSKSENVAVLPMVDIYMSAFQLFLGDSAKVHLLMPNHVSEVEIVLEAMVKNIRGLGPDWPSSEELHIVRQYLGFMNLVWPSFYAMAFSPRTSVTLEQSHIKDILGLCQEWTSRAEAQLRSALQSDRHAWGDYSLFPFAAQPPEADNDGQSQVELARLAESIIMDIRKNWVTLSDRLTIQAPGQRRSTQLSQAEQGVKKPQWDLGELVVDLYERVQEWNYWWDRVYGMHPAVVSHVAKRWQIIF